MKTLIAATLAALAIGAAPVSTALAFDPPARHQAYGPSDVDATGALGRTAPLGVHDGPFYESCPMSSAAESNANQQTRPVKQYGQTAGGNLC
ncbi:hypothetical protein [Methylobacterium sp. JK268]